LIATAAGLALRWHSQLALSGGGSSPPASQGWQGKALPYAALNGRFAPKRQKIKNLKP